VTIIIKLPEYDTRERNKRKTEALESLLKEKSIVPAKSWFIEKFS
jgi:hypothetical protein